MDIQINLESDVVPSSNEADDKGEANSSCSRESDEDELMDGQGMSHQEAMEQFKDALAEIIVVSKV